MGPTGGMKGGYVVAEGTPEEVAANPKSVTGSYLKKALDRGVRAGWYVAKNSNKYLVLFDF